MNTPEEPNGGSLKRLVGPTVHHHAAYSELVCTRCDYLKHNLIRSGRDPQWECLCLHPRAKEVAMSLPKPERVWSTNGADGCWIGENPETPEWCPERKSNRPNNKVS